RWYTLKSKPGKKDKERGEIEVDIQFMRNNMTASMFDLSVKDKSRNPFGKLKDKIRGKNKDSASDTASAILPSTSPSVDSDDESPSKDKKKKSKIKTLFSKSNLQKTPLSQSMSVLPTPKSDKVLLRPGEFQSRWEDDDEDESSSASDIMSHKRTASADPKQLNQVNLTLPKKEGLSFLGGLRSKNDSLSRSNVCINGNHVYVEQPEGKAEAKDSTSSSPSPQGFRKKHLFSSTENLSPRSWKEPGEGSAVSPDKWLSESSTKNSPKSTTLPPSWPPVSGDMRENTAPAKLEAVKESKESKKHENKKSSLLSLVTGKKDVAKGSEGESPASTPGKEQEGPLREDGPGPAEGLGKRSEKDTMAAVSGRGKSLNPFEEGRSTEPAADPEPKSERTPPVTSARAPQTKAVKPRLEVSPEVQPTARLPPPPDSLPFISALPSSPAQTPVSPESGREAETQSSESPSVFSAFSPPLAAPISTSTPITSWPSTEQGQAGAEEPSVPLDAEVQKESLTHVPSAVSCARGSLPKQPPTAVWKGTEAAPAGKTSETDTEKDTSGDDSAQCPPKQPEMGQQEEPPRFPPKKQQDYPPASEGAREVTSALSARSGRTGGPAGKPPMGVKTDLESRSGFFEEDRVRGGEMTATIKQAVPPLRMGEPVLPLHSTMRRHEEMGLNGSEGPKKIKKHVSFSEQLFREEEAEKSPGLVGEDESHPQELGCEGAAAGDVCDTEPAECPHAEDSEGEAVTEPRPLNSGVPAAMARPLLPPSHEDSDSEGPGSEASSGQGMEGDDTLLAQNQSKASDHEGLLSDPLGDLQSASDVKSPVTADLDLTLPSIPEVTSDDERVDEVEDDREAAKVAAMGGGASSRSRSPAHPEKAPGGGAGGSAVPADSLRELRSEAPEAAVRASSEHTTASGILKPSLGKSSRLDTQQPGPGDGEEAEVMGNGRLRQPPAPALDSPPSSPSFSEPSPATHSPPSSPHSDTPHTSTAESQKKAAAEGLPGKVENSGKRKPLLQAWVSPSETHPVSAGTGSAKHRPHLVKPMNTRATKITNSSLGTATIISENLINEAIMKKYTPSDPAFAYAQLTHDELIQLVLKQKETINKKEFQVRELEDYIDNLLVRVMEETPNILRVPAQVGKKAGKM
uniref:RAB11 family interacting protein 1 n=2 Tax=Myotis lucifugus TaxID=59463 RepID=G1P9C1_MYOLU